MTALMEFKKTLPTATIFYNNVSMWKQLPNGRGVMVYHKKNKTISFVYSNN